MIEIKMGKNILIEGNTFEGWMVGFTITSRNQGSTLSSGGIPWAGLFNVTIINNWWKRMQNWDRIYGFPIGGPQLQDNEYSNVRSGPFTFSNNLIESGVEEILASFRPAGWKIFLDRSFSRYDTTFTIDLPAAGEYDVALASGCELCNIRRRDYGQGQQHQLYNPERA